MEKKILSVVVGILIALLGWLGGLQIQKMAEISRDLIALRLEIVQLQKDILTKEDVKEMIETELLKHNIK
jgi:hypothetical protein